MFVQSDVDKKLKIVVVSLCTLSLSVNKQLRIYENKRLYCRSYTWASSRVSTFKKKGKSVPLQPPGAQRVPGS